MRISIDSNLKIKLTKIRRKNPQLFKRVQKQLKSFSINPKSKSLRIHKLSGELKNMWSLSVTKSIRMKYFRFEDEALFFEIGTHDEIYKK